VASDEASSHINFKNAITNVQEGDTSLSLKKLTPVRLLKNKFYHEVHEAEINGASKEELIELLGRGRAKKGMFEGDLDKGELEIGQSSCLIKKVQPASEIVHEIWNEYLHEIEKLKR
jgi:enoyl-[acyl-carrier protein] reductase II